MKAQGYSQGNRDLWLPKPEFQAYTVPFKPTTVPTGRHQQRRTTTRSSKRKHVQQKQRRQRPNNALASTLTKTNGNCVKTWIPKDKLAQMSTNEKSNLVWILARDQVSNAYEEWIVPQDLIKAQGYYEGQSQIWLPKALMKNQVSSKISQEEKPQYSNHINQWRSMKATSEKIPSYKTTIAQILHKKRQWAPRSSNTTHSCQVVAVKIDQRWVHRLHYVNEQ